MVPIALMSMAPQIRGSEVLIFIDNPSALHSLVKGSSKDGWNDLDVAITQLVAAFIDLHLHFGLVERAANWADSVPRHLDLDDFAREYGFPLAEATPTPSCTRRAIQSSYTV